MAMKPVADLTSSMTSVTEEDGSFSESDTTETCNSNFSSLLYSSDNNTDDKLTPCLNSISISKGSSCKKFKRSTSLTLNVDSNLDGNVPVCDGDNENQGHMVHDFVHPITSFSSNLEIQCMTRAKRKSTKPTLRKKYINRTMTETGSHSRFQPDIERSLNSFTFDNPDYSLYTDFSQNNNCFPYNAYMPGAEHLTEEDDEESEQDISIDRSFFPDMTSPAWYTAQVFDTYWSHYSFAMDWYQNHVKFVQSQITQHFNPVFPMNAPRFNKKKNISKEKRKKHARKRKGAKVKKKEKPQSDDVNVESDENDFDGEDTFEMEITEDMMDFFSQSFKHRLERDKGKQEDENEKRLESRIAIDQAMSGQQGPCTNAPNERPGVRRTAEMKLLYGKGAAMIHGMETALQMTFDKVVDRHQPKLWPNMPLKMCFA